MTSNPKKDKKERILGEFKTRKTGNTLTLTVPSSAGKSAGEKFLLVAKPNGTLEYRSVQANPWLDGKYDDIDFQKELNDVGNFGLDEDYGKEQVDW